MGCDEDSDIEEGIYKGDSCVSSISCENGVRD